MNIREQMKSIKASANAKYRFSVYVCLDGDLPSTVK